jgi:hypothetical protein
MVPGFEGANDDVILLHSHSSIIIVAVPAGYTVPYTNRPHPALNF